LVSATRGAEGAEEDWVNARRSTKTTTEYFVTADLTTSEALALRDAIGCVDPAQRVGPLLSLWNALSSALGTEPPPPGDPPQPVVRSVCGATEAEYVVTPSTW
jgi:hypothetical protein